MGCALCASDGQSFYVCVYVHTALTPLNPASQTVRNLTSPNDAAMMHVYVCVRACVRACVQEQCLRVRGLRVCSGWAHGSKIESPVSSLSHTHFLSVPPSLPPLSRHPRGTRRLLACFKQFDLTPSSRTTYMVHRTIIGLF